MKRIFQPSLFRRTFIALFLAFAIVMVVLLGYSYWILFAPDGMLDTRRKLAATSIAETLAEQKGKDADIRTILPFLERIYRNDRIPKPRDPVYLIVWDAKGKLVYADAHLKNVAYFRDAHQRGSVTLGGVEYLVVNASKSGYTVALAEPIKGLHGYIMSVQLKQLLHSMVIAFPFVLIPVWFAVYSGLRPLRKLSDSIERRDPDDLSPIEDRPPYREMLSLTGALDSLFLRLKKKIALEKAFVHDAAHELQTPLAVVANQVHVLSSTDAEEGREESRRHAEGAITRASHVVRQLLELASFDSVRPIETERMNIAEFVREVVAQLVPGATARRVEVMVQAPDSLMLHASRHAFYSTVNNLVDNAIRYVGHGGRVVVELEADDVCCFLRVLDDGPGIGEADRERVFDRFYRVATQDSDERGSGLGLAIVKQAVRQMGGAIRLDAGLHGRGCGFFVTIAFHSAA